MKILLIAPPWPLFNRPSIQTAALKAYLLQQEPGLEVRCKHPYLLLATRLGHGAYHAVSQSSWAAESICAAILFPRQGERCLRLYEENLKARVSSREIPDPENVKKATSEVLQEFLAGTDWNRIDVVGLSACLNQLTASLLLAGLIKKINKDIKIVMGGASCAGSMGPSLLAAFPQVDYTINGEGERPLLSLVRGLLEGNEKGSFEGVSSRHSPPACVPSKIQIKRLDDLPPPDYDDYFQELYSLPASKRFFPVLPVEFSRGCWWRRCKFCNLNLQWSGYRAKSNERMAREILYLSRRYGTLDFSFTDNVLPRRAAALFRELGSRSMDLGFFAELRAVHTRDEIHAMARGGLHEVQVGIEALSDSLLSRLDKGVRLIDNVAAMRHAEEAGIRLSGNLIIHFPGSTEREVEETLETLDFVWPYRPLKTVSFWLGMGSPVHLDARSYGIAGIKFHPFYSDLFPGHINNRLKALVLTYRRDRVFQRRIWKPVEDRVKLWRKQHARRPSDGPLLSYRDGGEHMIIRRLLPDGRSLTHRLSGLSRRLYLLCTDITPLEKVLDQAPGLSREKVLNFIQDLRQKGLMFTQGDQVLSLAVHGRNPR